MSICLCANEHLIKVPKEAQVPFVSKWGWYYFKGHQNTRIEGCALIRGEAKVRENAQVFGDAVVAGRAIVEGNAMVWQKAEISGNAVVSGYASVYLQAKISGEARVHGNAQISGDARVGKDALIYGNARLHGSAKAGRGAYVNGDARISGGLLVGPALTASCLGLTATMSAPSTITVGDRTYPYATWVDPQAAWHLECCLTTAERAAMLLLFHALKAQEDLGETWGQESEEI